ncbi:MAG: aldo/keto reductase family oxidoreductase [Opitutales bacterium]
MIGPWHCGMQFLEHFESRLKPSRIGLGCMTFGKTWDGQTPVAELLPRGRAALEAAVESGINFFDHADIYCRGRSEEVFAAAVTDLGLQRESLWIQGKVGIRPGFGFDFSHAHIVEAVEGCLKRLETGYLDSLLLHRPDALMEPEEVARAFEDLEQSGKVRHFGVSNQTAGQMALLRQFVKQPLRFNQVELSLLHTQMLDEGVDFNRDIDEVNPTRQHGCLDYCRLHGITPQPWGPLAKGKLSGRESPDDNDRIQGAREKVTEMAAKYDVPNEAVVVGWLLRHPGRFQPLIGTTGPERIRNAAQAAGLELSREDWYALWVAGRGRRLP